MRAWRQFVLLLVVAALLLALRPAAVAQDAGAGGALQPMTLDGRTFLAPSSTGTAKVCTGPTPVPVEVASRLTDASAARADLKPAKASLVEFAWLEGRWRGTLRDTTFHAEQQWWPAKAGLMAGMFRLTDGEKLLVVEFFTLRETPAGIELRLRHFDAALNPMEKGDPIILQLTSASEGEALFENPVHARPKHSRITRTGPDSYVGRSEIIGDAGTVRVIEARWTREPAKANECPDL